MAIPSGLGSQMGISTEMTYGTTWRRRHSSGFQNESLRLTKNYIRNFELGGQALVQAESLHAATTRDGWRRRRVLGARQGHGEVAEPAARQHGHPDGGDGLAVPADACDRAVTSPTGKSATIQIGKPDVTGTAQPFSYLGCKVTNMVFTLQRDGVVTVSVTIDAQDEVTNQTLAVSDVPDFGAALFNFISASVEFNGRGRDGLRQPGDGDDPDPARIRPVLHRQRRPEEGADPERGRGTDDRAGDGVHVADAVQRVHGRDPPQGRAELPGVDEIRHVLRRR